MHDEFRKKLIEEHMEMAGAIASECLTKYNLASLLPYDDLLAYARAGLVEAAHKYDPGAGVHFRSYSWSRIKGAVLDGIRRNSRYSRAYRGQDDDGRDDVSARPSAKGSHPQSCRTQRTPSRTPARFNTRPKKRSTPAEYRAALLRAVQALPARDRDVILRHYFRGEPIKDIAEQYSFDPHTVVRFHCRSLSASVKPSRTSTPPTRKRCPNERRRRQP